MSAVLTQLGGRLRSVSVVRMVHLQCHMWWWVDKSNANNCFSRLGWRSVSLLLLHLFRATGEACPLLMEEISCNTDPCVLNCEVSNWSKWSTCTASCGGGTTSRSRTILVHPANGGTLFLPLPGALIPRRTLYSRVRALLSDPQ